MEHTKQKSLFTIQKQENLFQKQITKVFLPCSQTIGLRIGLRLNQMVRLKIKNHWKGWKQTDGLGLARQE